MAFTTINDPSAHFQTTLYTGNGGTQNITNGGNSNLRPDFAWIKDRTSTNDHKLTDSIRGSTYTLEANATTAQYNDTNSTTAFLTDGFSLGANGNVNTNSSNYVAWQWTAGGPTPAITFIVKVVSDGGNKYRLDNATFSTHSITTYLQEGGTYTFDLSDNSNDGHPMKFSTTSNGTHGGGTVYSTGVVYQLDGSSVTESNYVSNFNSATTRKLIITVAASAPTLYYFCHYHSGMGGALDTNDKFTTSNYYGNNGSATVRETVNPTAGVSILRYAATGSDMTIGHRLGAKPHAVWVKNISGSANWRVFHHLAYTGDSSNQYQNGAKLNTTSAWDHGANSYWNGGSASFTNTTISLGTNTEVNDSGAHYVAYAFTGIKGFSKFGMYRGNGDAQGRFCFTGFRPEWVMWRECTSGNTNDWNIVDATRSNGNLTNLYIRANESSVDADGGSNYALNFLSNGFKVASSNAGVNRDGGEFVYFAFAKSPMVANEIPGTAAY